MAAHRRRHHHHHHNNHSFYNRLRSLLPLISAVSLAILVLFVIISFFAPLPLDSHKPRGDGVTSRVSYSDVAVDGAVGLPVFRIPEKGKRSDRDVWSFKNSKYFYGCSDAGKHFANALAVTEPNRYLVIAASGGLNQQRTGITDAVVAARILNATLVVPKLDQKSFWKDASNFSEIFDVNWFISSLSNDVKIIKSLPLKAGKTWTIHSMRVPRKCNERCYLTRVLPVVLKRHAIQLSKFDYRLSNRLDTQLQKLRCRVNYNALKFTDPIREMGEKLVHRVRMKSKRYIALHLRFEPDMLAFSGCYYGGGDKERKELGALRKRWKTLHMKNPDKMRRQGRCPLTPHEIGMMLRALGYGSDVHMYVASGVIYGGEETLAPLKALFPNFYTKETIASKEELNPFSSFSSRMAALDFIVCDESDVFVTNNNGNMAKIIAGRRRYFGHKPTIRPNAKKLYRLFLNRDNMTWEEFASSIRTYQRGFMGAPKEVRPGRGEFHENPHTCICEDSEAEAKTKAKTKAKKDSASLKFNNDDETPVDDVPSDDQAVDDDQELTDRDDDADEGFQEIFQENGLLNSTNLDYDGIASEEPELEEILSD